MSQSFIHLNVHSEFSLVDGIVKIKPLIEQAAKLNMAAVAVTDLHNLFAAVKFYRAATAKGIKPIFGSEVLLTNESDEKHPFKLILLCQNTIGYKNLTRLISKAYVEGQQTGRPLVKREWVKEYAEGLIALSAASQGDIGCALLADKRDNAKQLLTTWMQIFPGRFYLQVQRTGQAQEARQCDLAVALAIENNCALVATNAVCFLSQSDFDAHEARVCIHDGFTLDDQRRPRHYTAEQYLKSSEQMSVLFADIPESLENSIEIAKRCNVKLSLGTPYLPDFPIPADTSIEKYLAHCAQNGLQKRLNVIFANQLNELPSLREAYDQRLQIELDVINGMGFAGYFLIVADFIQWAKDNKIPVGPGRGSGAGSLVAYALKITDLDPLQYELLFERFLNPERVSMPDFDIDFCMEGRDRVIDYVAQTYGRDSVSQIITFGTMTAKAVIRDVGRVLGHPYGFVDKIAKLIPFEIGITLDKALKQEEELQKRYQQEEDVQLLIDLAKKLEGITRNAGKHAGGVVIAPSKLTDFSALYCESSSENIVTQFDKDDVEAVGLVKFDFLGLRTLTIINWAVANLPEVDIHRIATDDKATFKLLQACQTTAIFQLESRGMKDLIHRLQPDSFEEIIALVALFRPGPLQSGMVDDFINRKHGRAQVVYPHPELEPILKPTYGVILYQEQVMQIAQVLAGYTLGAADMLRRAMGKKKPEEMAKQREIFTQGALKRGVEEKTATHIFDLMEKFAGYGFNKSHSAAYALVSYQTAWLKTHYPAAFMAAVLSSDMDHTDKVVTFIEDCRTIDLTVEPPNINQGECQFTLHDNQAISYGLGAIKGLGGGAIESIVNVRNKEGEFTDLFDFCQRVDSRKVNRRAIEALIRSGAMDALGPNRASMFMSIDKALKLAEQSQRLKSSGQISLFNFSEQSQNGKAHPDYLQNTTWSEQERLTGEKETLGLYLTGHPIDQYSPEILQLSKATIHNLLTTEKKSISLFGMIIGIRTMQTKRNDRMAFISLDDSTGRIEIAVFADRYSEYKDIMLKGTIVCVEGEVSQDDYTGGLRMRADKIKSMQQVRDEQVNYLSISASETAIDLVKLNQLKQLVTPYISDGFCPIRLILQLEHEQVTLNFGSAWQVRAQDELLRQLTEHLPNYQVIWKY